VALVLGAEVIEMAHTGTVIYSNKSFEVIKLDAIYVVPGSKTFARPDGESYTIAVKTLSDGKINPSYNSESEAIEDAKFFDGLNQ
jgi:hypothetical protein